MTKTNKDKKISGKEEKNKSSESDEPSWYHYLIVIIVFILVFYGISFLFNLNKGPSNLNYNDNGHIKYNSNKLKSYEYNYTEDGKIYHFEFNSPVSVLRNYSIPLDIDKYTLLNSKEITLVFLDYNSTDNKYVTISSVKLMKLLKYYFHFSFNENDFKKINEFNCSNSTLSRKVIIFNPYSNTSGVYYNNISGCININSNNVTNLVKVTDKFMLSLISS